MSIEKKCSKTQTDFDPAAVFSHTVLVFTAHTHKLANRERTREREIGSMGLATALLTLLSIFTVTARAFNCTGSSGTTCNGLVGYISPNATTLSDIRTMFGIPHFRYLLGANNFPLSTPRNQTVSAKQVIKIPFTCHCTNNGTGIPRNRRPIYNVVAGDGLYHIAAKVFSGLVTYPEIQAVNNISDANLIEIGQELWIPLPCSCDEVEGQRVVHYGHVVQSGSSVDEIAQQYNVSADTLLKLNGLTSSNQLLADTPFDVPLKACASMVRNDSLDYPLLVANGTYVFTAGNCVMCKCDAAYNWTLQCEPSQAKSSLSGICPPMQCEGSGNLSLGNTSSCTTCAYAGYNNQTILTTLVLESSTCSGSGNNASKSSLHSWSWSYLLISIHLTLLCLHIIQ
ncbi:hypothetical protein ACSBR1_003577 [Camellia fascicularis]